jgi:methylated-DNA-[protein]-cysteine S-methyltransferase
MGMLAVDAHRHGGTERDVHRPIWNEMLYTIFSTPLGWMGLLGSPAGLRQVVLPQPSPQAVQRILSQIGATPEESFFGDLPQRINKYLSGEPLICDEALDIRDATSFQQQVWQAARNIPYGQTRSYQWLARQAGRPRAARAVGQALAANPLPIIIPCHRVVTSQGKLGGFAGGLALKRRLLELERSQA